jgi:hypothetical protein
MIEKTLQDIEARIKNATAIKDADKRELLQLLATLNAEMVGLAQTHGQQAESIARFAAASTHEATRDPVNPRLFRLSVDGLAASVAELEQSHPRLVQVTNAICNVLSNWGI